MKVSASWPLVHMPLWATPVVAFTYNHKFILEKFSDVHITAPPNTFQQGNGFYLLQKVARFGPKAAHSGETFVDIRHC